MSATLQHILVWLDPLQLPFVRSVAARAKLRVTVAGTPARGRSGEIAEALGGCPADDLRASLLSLSPPGTLAGGAINPGDTDLDRCDLVWLASLDQAAAIDAVLLDAIRACIDRGITVVTSEPIPGAVPELGSFDDQSGVAGPMSDSGVADALDSASPDTGWPALVPLFRAGKTMPDVAESREDFGPIRTAHFVSLGRRCECSLGTRIVDAMDTIRSLLGEPEEIYATHVPTLGITRAGTSKSGLDSLRDLSGTLTVNLRFSDGTGGTILASDAAGEWRRSLTLLGDPNHPKGGRLRVTDSSLEWIGSDGTVLERTRKRRQIGPIAPPPLFDVAPPTTGSVAVDVFADALSQVGRRRAGSLPAINHVGVLSMAGAALLSARTGQPESPTTIRRMVGAG